MNKLTNEERLKKLEAKAAKIQSKIDQIKSEQTKQERIEAFDTIMELGEKHRLFKCVEPHIVVDNSFITKSEYIITMINIRD